MPVLTPRLSSYWLALVTDVDITTGRNLIDSMGTEVLVTDDSIREVVPGEPVSYAEAVRRALEERRAPMATPRPAERCAERSGEERRQREQPCVSDQVTWVRIGARMPPGGTTLQPDDEAEQDGGEGQHHVAGRQRRHGVGHGGDRHRVPRDGGVGGAAEEQLLGDPVQRR